MAGALGMAFGTARRRGWEDGGFVADDELEGIAAQDQDRRTRSPTPQQAGAMARAAGTIPLPPPVPPLQQGLDEGVGDAGAVQRQGALGQGTQDPDAQKAATIQRATQNILGASGQTNLPLLMAAAGLLKPTTTGGFAESLSNAFSAAVPVAEQERQMRESALLRQQQQEWQRTYQAGILGIRGQHEASYADVANARTGQLQAAAALATARAAMVGASHATEGDVLSQSVKTLTTPGPDGNLPINPDTGKPWQPAEAFRYLKGIDVRATNAATSSRRADIAADANDWRKANAGDKLAMLQDWHDQTGQYRDAKLALQKQGLNETQIAHVISEANTRALQDPGGYRKPLQSFIDQVRGVRENMGAAAAEPTAQPAARPAQPAAKPGVPTTPLPQEIADAKAALARGAPREAVIKMFVDKYGQAPAGL